MPLVLAPVASYPNFEQEMPSLYVYLLTVSTRWAFADTQVKRFKCKFCQYRCEYFFFFNKSWTVELVLILGEGSRKIIMNMSATVVHNSKTTELVLNVLILALEVEYSYSYGSPPEEKHGLTNTGEWLKEEGPSSPVTLFPSYVLLIIRRHLHKNMKKKRKGEILARIW